MRLHPEQMAHKTYFWVLFNYTNKFQLQLYTAKSQYWLHKAGEYTDIDADMDK